MLARLSAMFSRVFWPLLVVLLAVSLTLVLWTGRPENAKYAEMACTFENRVPACIDSVDAWREGLAFFDTSTAIRRLQDNASDKFLEVVEPTDIRTLLQQLPQCRAIVTTGEKATETICTSLGLPEVPKVNSQFPIPNSQLVLCRLPSSSRAYPLSFDKKVEAYRIILSAVGVACL